MSTTEYLLIHTCQCFVGEEGGWRFHQEVFPFAVLLFLFINNSPKQKGLYVCKSSPHRHTSLVLVDYTSQTQTFCSKHFNIYTDIIFSVISLLRYNLVRICSCGCGVSIPCWVEWGVLRVLTFWMYVTTAGQRRDCWRRGWRWEQGSS